MESVRRSPWFLAFYLFVFAFTLNIMGIAGHVLVSSFAKSWFGGPLPASFTAEWYPYNFSFYGLGGLMAVTFEVVIAVMALSLSIGFLAAYALARVDFPGKRYLTVLFLLPVLLPQIAYGIPLATVLYRYGLGGTVAGVILANAVPMIPFAMFILMPFIEQIDRNMESSARVLGASRLAIIRRVLLPLSVPGLLTAGVLTLTSTVANFELTFLVSGAGSQTIVVALYYAMFAAGIRPTYSVDAMAVIYMVLVMIPLAVALRFVRPTQMVFRIGEK